MSETFILTYFHTLSFSQPLTVSSIRTSIFVLFINVSQAHCMVPSRCSVIIYGLFPRSFTLQNSYSYLLVQHSSSFFFYLFIYLFIYLWLSWVFSCARAFSSCSKQGLLFIAVCWLLIAVASVVAEHRLQERGLQQLQHAGSVVVACGLSSCGSRALEPRLSSCGTWAQLLRGM